jgi:hypothetical protein
LEVPAEPAVPDGAAFGGENAEIRFANVAQVDGSYFVQVVTLAPLADAPPSEDLGVLALEVLRAQVARLP